MPRPSLLLGVLGLLLPACAGEAPLHPGDVAAPASPPPSPDESGRKAYSDKTVLYYDPSHGNQIEYTGPDGRAFLWYPTNRSPLPGDWRIDGQRICFQYGESSFNPVTGDHGGEWECTPLEQHERHMVDSVSGDVFGLATGSLPFRLPVHPRFDSIADVKALAPR
ncbi:hypothetical protein [Sorangium sp. So ce385]|uniref:hypothetical protein n=1 Tax=Sorangium sp. So ce385 TaxID=3133308 RepID=UPI003F5B5472